MYVCRIMKQIEKEENNKEYMTNVRPQLIRDTFLNSLFLKDNEWYFIDVYVGIPIKITENQYNALKYGKDNEINEFSEYYNEEHIVPSSIYNKKKDIVKDLHNVLPVIKFVNDKRSNLDIIDLPKDIQDKQTVEKYCYNEKILLITTPSNKESQDGCFRVYTPETMCENWYPNLVSPMYIAKYKTCSCLSGNCYFEPAKSVYRGLIARTILYFDDKYRNDESISKEKYEKFMNPSAINQFIDWNNRYPPTDFEKSRHEKIKKAYGTTNKFTEHYSNQLTFGDILRKPISISSNPFYPKTIKKN